MAVPWVPGDLFQETGDPSRGMAFIPSPFNPLPGATMNLISTCNSYQDLPFLSASPKVRHVPYLDFTSPTSLVELLNKDAQSVVQKLEKEAVLTRVLLKDVLANLENQVTHLKELDGLSGIDSAQIKEVIADMTLKIKQILVIVGSGFPTA